MLAIPIWVSSIKYACVTSFGVADSRRSYAFGGIVMKINWKFLLRCMIFSWFVVSINGFGFAYSDSSLTVHFSWNRINQNLIFSIHEIPCFLFGIDNFQIIRLYWIHTVHMIHEFSQRRKQIKKSRQSIMPKVMCFSFENHIEFEHPYLHYGFTVDV